MRGYLGNSAQVRTSAAVRLRHSAANRLQDCGMSGLCGPTGSRIMASQGLFDDPRILSYARGQSDSGEASAPPSRERGAGRARHCWEIIRTLPDVQFNCEECYAYFVQQDCWTLWALRRPGFKPCCQKKGDCAECVVLSERLRPTDGELIQIEPSRPVRPGPSSSKRVCGYLQLYQGLEEVAEDHRTSSIARALQVRNADLRCRLRGVHLDIGYVNDVCVSRHVDECVFLDEVRPDVHVAPIGAFEQAGQNSAKRALDKGGLKKTETQGGETTAQHSTFSEKGHR